MGLAGADVDDAVVVDGDVGGGTPGAQRHEGQQHREQHRGHPDGLGPATGRECEAGQGEGHDGQAAGDERDAAALGREGDRRGGGRS